MKTTSYVSAAAIMVAGALAAAPAMARDQIKVVGSSTVFPYSQAAAEEFANKTGNTPPVVESTGTGGGMKIFCQGIGPDHADMTGASRAMKQSEWELCNKNGVKDVTELLIGYDGLSIAVSRKNSRDWDLTEAQIFQALAAKVEVDGKIVDNPYKSWNQIDASLPDTPIIVIGPPPTSGTRDAFVELAMHDGCEAFPAIKALKGDEKNDVCSRMRQDGPFIEAGENDNLIVQRLNQEPDAVGIFGYSFLFENSDTLKPVSVEGIEPSFESIADFSYDIARPIFVYVKNAHRQAIPGLNDFIKEYVSDEALGDGGYQQERGLTVMNDERRAEMQKRAMDAAKFDGPSS